MLITGFAVGPHETNCYLVAARASGPAIVIDPGDEAVGTLEYYFTVNGTAYRPDGGGVFRGVFANYASAVPARCLAP